jgi:hypothetical protein
LDAWLHEAIGALLKNIISKAVSPELPYMEITLTPTAQLKA